MLAGIGDQSPSAEIRQLCGQQLEGWPCAIRAPLTVPELSDELRDELGQALREFYNS
jgi:hypothetical protein